MQTLLIIMLFALAAGWLGWRGYRAVFAPKPGCGKGCGCDQVAQKPGVR